jgi:hypothetical protein
MPNRKEVLKQDFAAKLKKGEKNHMTQKIALQQQNGEM